MKGPEGGIERISAASPKRQEPLPTLLEWLEEHQEGRRIMSGFGLRLLQAVAEAVPVKRLFKRAHIDVKCGACSGFPVCCIAFMSFVWSPAFMRWGTRMVAGKLLQKPERDRPFLLRWYTRTYRRRRSWGYIPCPLCLLRKHKVTPRRCEAGCSCGLGDWRAQRKKERS